MLLNLHMQSHRLCYILGSKASNPSRPMALQSLQRLMKQIEQQKTWQAQHIFRQVVSRWPELVGEAVALQTRPTSLQDQVLQVAVANASWAQNLMFERRRLMQKINAELNVNLRDIRFSTAKWGSSTGTKTRMADSLQIWQQHPSRISDGSDSSDQPSADGQNDRRFGETDLSHSVADPREVFERWAKRVQVRSQSLPLCPQCHCPTPQGELERWSVCSLCVTKRW